MLQCEVCVQLSTANTAKEPAASLHKAAEVAEMLHPVYIYCVECSQHLCSACDYKKHISGEEEVASETNQKAKPSSALTNLLDNQAA